MDRPNLQVAVIMRRERLASRWQVSRWVLDDVVPHDSAFGTEPRLLDGSAEAPRWLHPGYMVELFRDEVDGYDLNLSADAPGWFVLWRMEEQDGAREPLARPAVVTLSYHEAARWLDAQETVEQVPAPPAVVEWLREFVDAHRIVEPRQRRRPESFRPLRDRFGNPASVTTGTTGRRHE